MFTDKITSLEDHKSGLILLDFSQMRSGTILPDPYLSAGPLPGKNYVRASAFE